MTLTGIIRAAASGGALVATAALAVFGVSALVEDLNRSATNGVGQVRESRHLLYLAVAGEELSEPVFLSDRVVADLQRIGADLRGVVAKTRRSEASTSASPVEALAAYTLTPGRFSDELGVALISNQEPSLVAFDRDEVATGAFEPDVRAAVLVLTGPDSVQRAALLDPPSLPTPPGDSALPELSLAVMALGATSWAVGSLALTHTRRREEALEAAADAVEPDVRLALRARLQDQHDEIAELTSSPHQAEALLRLSALLAEIDAEVEDERAVLAGPGGAAALPGPLSLTPDDERVCEVLAEIDLVEHQRRFLPG